jgi:taurine dioxygenase
MGDAATLGFEVRHLHPFTGAEVAGLGLAGPLSAGHRSALDRLLAERGVLVFRDQRLDTRSFAAAVEGTFGELMPQQLSQFALPDFPIVGSISNADADRATGQRVVRGEQYHTDHSNYPAPPRATALFGVAIPRTGGDTQFANVQAAYDGLPGAMKARLEGLASLHAFQSSRSPRRIATPTPEERARMPETVQPIVVAHPVTGRKGLYLNTARMEASSACAARRRTR